MLSVADNGMRSLAVIAFRIVAIMFLAEFALALIRRFAPQVQVFVLSMPIKSASAVLIRIFYFSRLLTFATGELAGVEPEIKQLVEVLGHASEADGGREGVR